MFKRWQLKQIAKLQYLVQKKNGTKIIMIYFDCNAIRDLDTLYPYSLLMLRNWENRIIQLYDGF